MNGKYRYRLHQQNGKDGRHNKKNDVLVKENIKSKEFLTQNIQGIWETMKRITQRIIRTKVEKNSAKGPRKYFNKIIQEKILT